MSVDMSKLRELLSNRSANVAVMTALSALPLVGVTGLAIDFASEMVTKTSLDAGSDAAALAAVKATAQSIQGGSTTSKAIRLGEQAARKVFKVYNHQINTAIVPDINLVDNKVVVNLSYNASFDLAVGKMFGFPTGALRGTVSATMSLPSYINVYLMVDTSGSMSIGASSTDQQNLINQIGCAFACHDGNPVYGYADAYAYAEARGISLRYDVINTGIKQFLSRVDTLDPTHQYIKVAVYSFDSNLNVNAPLTSDTDVVRQNLPTAPATSGDYDGATHFNESIPSVMSTIGAGGDGMSSGNPKKLLIIATDGVQDPSRTWTSNLALRPQVQVIDTSFCNTLSSLNVSVAFIHMPYLAMPWDWGYDATLGQASTINPSKTRADIVQPALKACAGDLYTQANDTTSLTDAFTQLLQGYVGTRLTK